MDLNRLLETVKSAPIISSCGRVTRVVGMLIEGEGPGIAIGGHCQIEVKGAQPVLAQVVGFRGNRILLMPLGEMEGIKPGGRIYLREDVGVPVGEDLLGRVLDALGNPLDGGRLPRFTNRYSLYNRALNPLKRARITQPLDVGIRAINGLLTLGKGQRVAIMAGSGVGKSTLLGMIARYTSADVNVIALIGERGREVREFLEKELGEEGLARSVVVVATSDQAPLLRLRGAYLATAIAEYFRDQGKDVLLMMDSVTRFCMAGREVGLAVGEPPTSRGYTPSVFAQLPKLLERAGNKEGSGSITGIYTVLVDGDDFNEPVADAVRSIVDGHIVLSRELANQGHWPAIDVLASISRVMHDIVKKDHWEARGRLVQVLSTYRRVEDLINIGAYARGSNPEIDYAIKMIGPINQYLRQGILEKADFAESLERLKGLMFGVKKR
ncbi:flagellar protein export ATPase FliI [Thermosulfuriphilus sp.]